MTQPQQEKDTKQVFDIKISDEKKTDNVSVYSTDGSEISTEGYIHDLQWTEEEERAVVNKIDIRLMSFVLLMTFVLNMDRTNICKAPLLYTNHTPCTNNINYLHTANAISDNLPADLGFGINGVNTGTLVHSIVFTVGTLFTNPIVKRVGAHRWIPILMNSWAIVTWAHALIHVSVLHTLLFRYCILIITFFFRISVDSLLFVSLLR